MSDEVVETKVEEVPKYFDNSPTTNEEEKRGIIDWADAITQANLAVRQLADAVVLKKRPESRAAMDRLNKAAHDLNLYLISRGV